MSVVLLSGGNIFHHTISQRHDHFHTRFGDIGIVFIRRVRRDGRRRGGRRDKGMVIMLEIIPTVATRGLCGVLLPPRMRRGVVSWSDLSWGLFWLRSLHGGLKGSLLEGSGGGIYVVQITVGTTRDA